MNIQISVQIDFLKGHLQEIKVRIVKLNY
jgi:hypothetical protein